MDISIVYPYGAAHDTARIYLPGMSVCLDAFATCCVCADGMGIEPDYWPAGTYAPDEGIHTGIVGIDYAAYEGGPMFSDAYWMHLRCLSDTMDLHGCGIVAGPEAQDYYSPRHAA